MVNWFIFLRLNVLIILSTALNAEASIDVIDDLGIRVELEKPARRVVALAPNIVENLWAIGAGDFIVGAVEYSDYPAAAKHVPRVGNYSSVSIEAILALNPDLIIAWRSGISLSTVSKLRSLGLAVYVDALPGALDIAETLRVYGRLLGLSNQASEVAQEFEADIHELKNNYSTAEPIRVFYQVWHDPIQSLNDESLIGELIGFCGGHNVFGDAASVAPIVSVESVIAADPDIILASGSDGQRPAWLDAWKKYPSISAVKSGALEHIHPDIIQRHTLRVLHGAKAMCIAIDRVRAE